MTLAGKMRVVATLAATVVGCSSQNSGAPHGGGDSGVDASTMFGGSGSSGSGGSTSSGSGGSGSGSGSGGSSGSSSGGGAVDASSGVPSDGAAVTHDAQMDPNCPANNSTQPSFVNLAPPMGAPLDPKQSDPIPGGDDAGVSVPQGWNFYQIDGALCRDGSPNGIFVHFTSSTKLMIYLEGGGACSSPHFCDHNPANILTVFPGGSLNGESFAGSLITQPGLQQPYTTGIFDETNDANPFKGWNKVYIPYCTGDVHFGTNDNAMIMDGVDPTVTNRWHFVGYNNMQKFVGRIAPTFKNVDQVALTGSSAGGFGVGLNFGMVQDAFGNVPVTAIDDSGPPFTDVQYLPACLQKAWRDLFGFGMAFPSDCAECTQSDGSGLTNIVLYLHHKYPNAKVGLVSSIHDQIIRLFFAAGMNDCATDDPNLLSTLGLQGNDVPSYPGPLFEMGLDSLRTQFVCTGALSTYYIGSGDPDASDDNGTIDTLHEHLFRDRFYQSLAGPGQPTLAEWVGDVMSGKVSQVGP